LSEGDAAAEAAALSNLRDQRAALDAQEARLLARQRSAGAAGAADTTKPAAGTARK
jgi:hypothetical protein